MSDPLLTLRAYRTLAPWSLRDLASLAGAILRVSGVVPINAAASAVPSERTVRFYVTRGLVAAPDGRGTAATYGYRHLLHVLMIKLRQMEGATLDVIAGELRELTGDVLERRVASTLGERIPSPALLPDDVAVRGGRAGQALAASPVAEAPTPSGAAPPGEGWRHLWVADGVELHVREDRLRRLPVADPDALASAIRRLLDAGTTPDG